MFPTSGFGGMVTKPWTSGNEDERSSFCSSRRAAVEIPGIRVIRRPAAAAGAAISRGL